MFPNFRVILKYNNAASYALAVGMLADRMAGGAAIAASWPRGERPLSRAERIQFQTELAKLGFDTGDADGVLGRRTRAALRQYQKSKALAADGFPTAALLASLDQDAATSSGNNSAAQDSGQSSRSLPAVVKALAFRLAGRIVEIDRPAVGERGSSAEIRNRPPTSRPSR